MKKEQKKEKHENRFLKFLFPESHRRSWKIIAVCTAIALIIGMVFAFAPIFDGKIFTLAFSDWIDCAESGSIAFVIYQIVLYAAVAAYAFSAMYILAKKETVEWCSVVIGISIIFVLFINVYLTLMINVPHGDKLYPNYVGSFSSVATILCAVAGIKMTYLLKKSCKEKEEQNGKPPENPDPNNETTSQK